MPMPIERPSDPDLTSACATWPAFAMWSLSTCQVTSYGRLPTKTVHASDSPSRAEGASRRSPRPPPSRPPTARVCPAAAPPPRSARTCRRGVGRGESGQRAAHKVRGWRRAETTRVGGVVPARTKISRPPRLVSERDSMAVAASSAE
eukprot:scaffold8224_cov118-Isochrysis_galbana.AAC.18